MRGIDILNYFINFIQKLKQYSKDEYLITIKWILRFSLAFGLLLTCFSEVKWLPWPLTSLFLHFGTALIIASIIGFFLEITEIKDFIEKRLISILFKDDYIESINEDRLIKLNTKTLEGIGKIRTGHPEYETGDLINKIQANALENIGQIYRKDFQEIIYYFKLKDNEIQSLGLNPQKVSGRLSRIEITTKFRLIAPKEIEHIFDLDCSYKLSLIPGLEQNKQIFLLELLINNEPVSIDIDHLIEKNRNNERFIVPVNLKATDDAYYTASIEYKIGFYQYDDLSARIKKSMNTLTHGANIHFSSREELEIDAEFFGVTNYKDPVSTPTSISIDYPDWALPEAGYFIYWRELKITED
jgi:hypothetical protein